MFRYPRMLMWYSLLLLVGITMTNMHACAVHANFSCRCLQTQKYTTGVTKYVHMCDSLVCATNSNQAVPYLTALWNQFATK